MRYILRGHFAAGRIDGIIARSKIGMTPVLSGESAEPMLRKGAPSLAAVMAAESHFGEKE
jgi:hypothetical protein